MKIINFAIAICIFFACTSSIYAASRRFTCDQKAHNKADDVVSKIIVIGSENAKYPENRREMARFCNQSNANLRYLKRYSNNCLPEMAQTATKVLIYTMTSQIKQLCNRRNQKRLNTMLQAAPCGNSAINVFSECYYGYIDSMLGANTMKNGRKKMPIGCCSFFRMKACLWEESRAFKQCSDAHMTTIERLVDSFSGNILNVLCGDLEEGSDKCDKLLKEVPKKPKNKKTPKSFLHPLIDIIVGSNQDSSKLQSGIN